VSAAVRAAFFLVPLLAAPLAHADRQAEDAQLNAAFAVEYDPQQMTALEPGVIAASGGWAKRDGATLSLNTEKSAAVTLTNDESGCQPDHPDHLKCYDFTLLAYLPGQHAFLVAESFDEGGKVLMIDDRTGTRTEFTELPRFSPDGKLLLVISNDEESNVGTIELWGRDGDMVKKLWTAPDTVGAEQVDFVAWNDDGIQLDLSFSQGDDKPEHHRPATLANGKSGWALTFKDGK
jgi:hypothetical protein